MQWDSKDGLSGWGVDFWNTINGIKKDLPDVNKEIQKFIEKKSEFFEGKDSQALEWIRSDTIDDAKNLSGVTDELKEDFADFLSTADLSGDIMEQYQIHLAKSANGTSRFSSFTKKAGNILKSFGASLASMGVNMAIGMALDFAIIAIDDYVNRVKYAQERLDEFSNAISESKNELETQKKWIEEHGDRYEELARGVDNYGHNVSLTADEFSEYQSITKDIADMFPNMISGYNEQNDAILKTKGSVDELTESYKSNVEAAYASTLAKSSDGFDDYKTAIEDAESAKKTVETLLNADKITGFAKPGGGFQFKIDGNYYADDIKKILDYDTYVSLLQEVEKMPSNHWGGNKRDFEFSDLSTGLQQKIRAALTTANATIKTETAKVRPILEAFVYGNSGKDSGFDALDEEGKQVIRNVISSLDDSFYEQFDSDSDMASYFYSYFIVPLKDGLDNTDLAIKINTLFSLNQNDYESYQDYVNAVNDIINQIKGYKDSDGNPLYSEEQINGLQNVLGVGKVNNSGQLSGQSLIDTVKDKYSSISGADEFIKTLSEKELRVLYELEPDEGKSLENLKQAVDALNKKSADETVVSTPKSFTEAWNSIGKSGTDEEKKAAIEAKEKLEELAEAGKLTKEALENSSLAKIFTDAGVSIEKATEKINKMKSSACQLASMKTGISSISSILGEKKENLSSKKTHTKGISIDTLAGMPEDVKTQTKEYENFIKVLGDGTSDMDKCKDAANELATAYVNSSNFLSNLTPETEKYYTSVLEEMGVENAAEVVTNALNRQKVNAKIATFDLKNATEQEIDKLGAYISSLDDSSNALGYYTLQQQISNNNALDTSDSIKQLKSLAKQCGITGEAISLMSSLAKDMKTVEYYTTGNGKNDKNAGNIVTSANSEINGNTKQLNKIINKGIEVGTSSKINHKNSSSSNGKDGSKSDKSRSTQQFDWISRALDRLSTRLNLVKTKYDNLFNNEKAKNSDSLLALQNKNLEKQYKLLVKTEKYQDKAAKKYSKKAKRVKISKNKKEDASLKRAVRKGRVSGTMSELIATYGEKKAEKIQKYQDWYDKSQEAKKNKISTQTAKQENRIQKYQNWADNADNKKALAQAQKENSQTAKKKNEQIDDEIGFLSTSYDYQIKIAKLEKDSLKFKQLQAEKAKELRDLQIEQHQNLADEYQSTLDQYNAEKELATKASDKNDLIEKEKVKASELYAEKIAIAGLENNISEQKQLQAELDQKLIDLEIEKHQNLADEHQLLLDRYSAEKELGKTAAEKNSYIESEKAATEALYNEKIEIAKLEGKADEEAKLRAELTKELTNLEIERHQNLADEHQANLDLLSAQKDNLNTAKEKNAVVDKERNTTIQLYQEKMEIARLEGNIYETQKLQEELNRQLVVLEKEKLDNIAEYYKNLRKIAELQNSEFSNAVDEMQAKGLIVTNKLYLSQIALSRDRKKYYEEELIALMEQHDKILEGTQEWYDSLDSIQACKDGIYECTKNVTELGNAIRNISWEIFDKMSTRLDLLTSEYELAVKLMSNKKMTNEKTGNFTEEGTATLGAYYSQLLLTQEKAEKLWKNLEDMKSNIDSMEPGYTDQTALDEYYEKYQDYISLIGTEHDMQQNLIELMKEKYQTELDYLQDLINKRKELLQAEKDAYDYQRSIEEKTKNIGAIQKQMVSLNGDDSESTKTRLQQLQVSLDEAQKDLADTEYQQWITDQQKMLDNLYNEYSDLIDKKLNDVDALLKEALIYLEDPDINGRISEVLKQYYDSYGYKPTKDLESINEALGEGGSIVTAIKDAAATITEFIRQQQNYQSLADEVTTKISEIGNVYSDKTAIDRFQEAQKSYNNLSTAGENGTNIQGYVSASSVSVLDTMNDAVRKIYEDVQNAANAIASIGALEDRSGYNETNRALIEKAYELYNALSTSGKQILGDGYKNLLDYKQAQYDLHGASIASETQQRQAQDNENKRNEFMSKIRQTYLQDGLTYADMYNTDTKNNNRLDKLLQQYGLYRSDGKSISVAGAASIMNQLGYSRPEQQTLEYMYRYMKDIGFSQGGIAETLQKVPAMNGDDGWTTLKRGEAVLTPEQTKNFQKLVQNLNGMNSIAETLSSLAKPKLNVTPNQNMYTTSVGDVHLNVELPNVVDPESFVREFQTNPKIEKIVHSMVYDGNRFGKYKW